LKDEFGDIIRAPRDRLALERQVIRMQKSLEKLAEDVQ